jgi:ABC-type transport system involved in Fe-S cluster assembly fused permease/ATPase subunit
MPSSFESEEKVKILLSEYTGLRSEIIAKTGHGLQVSGFVVTALSILVSQSDNRLTVWVIALIVLFVVAAAILIVTDVARAARRIKQIESKVNNWAGEKLLVWETAWGWGKEPSENPAVEKAQN